MKVDLSDKIAVITGAGGILAGNFAVHMAKCGAKVAVMDIDQAAAEKTAAEIRANGGEAIAIACDVLSKESMEEAEKKVVAAFGGYNILVNGAGGNNIKVSTTEDKFSQKAVDDPDMISFFDLDIPLFRRVVDLNLMGTFIPTQVFVKGLRKAEHPQIINMSSMSSYTALTRVVAYSNAKAAINSLPQWLTVHLGPLGIRVNAIAPGFFVTKQNKAMMTNPDGSLTPRSQKVIDHTPLGRMGEPDDLIGLLLFLCDHTASGYINGTVIPVDGGFMATPGV